MINIERLEADILLKCYHPEYDPVANYSMRKIGEYWHIEFFYTGDIVSSTNLFHFEKVKKHLFRIELACGVMDSREFLNTGRFFQCDTLERLFLTSMAYGNRETENILPQSIIRKARGDGV